MSLKKIFLLCGTLVILGAGLLLSWNEKTLISDNGNQTPYVVKYFIGRGVYYRPWSHGDLGGAYSYYPLTGVPTNGPKVHDLSVSGELFALLQNKDDFYLFQNKLPFNPLLERITGIERRSVPIIRTEKRVFFRSGEEYLEVSGADASTFEAVSAEVPYFFDRQRVYFLSTSGKFSAVTSLSPSNLKTIASYGYLTDGKSIAFEGRSVKGADAATFGDVVPSEDTEHYARDKKHVYYRGEMLEGVNPSKFKLLGRFPAFDTSVMIDGHSAYFHGQIISGLDSQSARFETGEKTYLTDKSGVRLSAEYDALSNRYVLK